MLGCCDGGVSLGGICFFIGHRDVSDRVLPMLSQAVEQHIVEYGVTDFFVGHYGRFDALAASTVKEAKRRHSTVTLTLLLPYHPFHQPMPTPEGFDSTFYPPGMENVPKRLAIVRANRWMIDHASHLIAYVSHPASNARNLLEYALAKKRKGSITVINLGDKIIQT